MHVLVVDTATPAVQAALVRVTSTVDVIAQRCTVNSRAHGELLAPQIAEVLAEAGLRPRDLGAVVAGLGPGPFTGLRVGLVTAAAFGQALSIPTYGVCSLDGIGAGTTGTALVAIDARRKEIYWAVYVDGERRTDPDVGRPQEVVAGVTGATSAVGDGALLHAGVLDLPVRDEPRYPVPQALAELAAQRIRAGAPSEPLHPLYLRRPDAVEPGRPKSVRQ